MKYLAVLGRLPEISRAELSALFGEITPLGKELATFTSQRTPDINRLGGTLKLAAHLDEPLLDYLKNLPEGKITLGLSDYSKNVSLHKLRQEALKLKKSLVKSGRSVRILENKSTALSTATSHHNHIAHKNNHIEIIKVDTEYYTVIGVQNITAYARRDQARPARDAKVGMLPPKLAQILINLCGPLPERSVLLDPFCGTGVVLQEAYLMGYQPYGTDKDPRIVSFAQKNLEWLCHTPEPVHIEVADATNHSWTKPIKAVATETYLGPPLSTPPSDLKLKQIKSECKTLILDFLKNLVPQLDSKTPVVLATPAWRRLDNKYSSLNILDEIENMGYNVEKITNSGSRTLLYYREGQVVAREIIVLRKK